MAVAIALAGILVAWALYASSGATFAWPWQWGAARGDPALVRPVAATDHIFGNPAAPAMLIVYCDFTSPYCQSFSTTMHELIANDGAGGQVAWVARAVPLSLTAGAALAEERAAACAARASGNDAYWRFADLLYANQPADPAQFGALAEEAGVAGSGFAQCYANASGQVDAAIKADRQNALDIGADGTPYSLLLVKGRAPVVIDGAYSYDALRAAVDQALGNG